MYFIKHLRYGRCSIEWAALYITPFCPLVNFDPGGQQVLAQKLGIAPLNEAY